jgi:glutamate dehydrogenase (NAD(P)+)
VQDLQNFFWNEVEVFDKLYRMLEQSFHQVLKLSKDKNVDMRTAATALGVQRVMEATRTRGLYP